MYRYEKRIIVLLSQIVKCCGEASYNKNICNTCKVRIAKCSRLVKRGQIPMSYYVKLVRAMLIEK